MAKEKTIIIGAGIGGLVAAALLSARGEDVLVLERQAAPGGKMRRLMVGNKGIDGGPTVFTMRGIFDAIFDTLGTSLERELKLKPLSILARHAWSHEERLDLHADLKASADAIGKFAGADEAKNFLTFSAEAKRIYKTLKSPFIESQKPNPISMALANGIMGLPDMMRINPFETMWRGITRHFKDPRLQQLFGRYATYCGSSPFEAVATLMLIAHVEQEGVWTVEGGMHEVAQSFARLAMERGARLQYQAPVKAIRVVHGAVKGVTLKSGKKLHAIALSSMAMRMHLQQDCWAIRQHAQSKRIANLHARSQPSHGPRRPIRQASRLRGTTSFSRAITRQNSTSYATATRPIRRFIFAPRIAMIPMIMQASDESVCSFSSTRPPMGMALRYPMPTLKTRCGAN